MRGTLIAYNEAEGRGLISGDDGTRYAFVRASLGSDPAMARAGQQVDFEAAGTEATNVYVVPSRSGGGQIGSKSKVLAGLLAIFLGAFGIHKFYLGRTGAGIIMLLVTILGFILVFPPIVISIIALVEGIIYLTKSDEDFYETYEVKKKAWF